MKKSSLVKEKIILVGGSGVNLKKINTYTDYKLDLNDIPSKKINSSQNEKIVILMLGRGMFEKGFFEYYEVAKLFNQLFPEKYLFMHAGYIDEDVLKNIENSDIYEFAKKYSVHYLGFRQDSAALLSYADIVAHPSSYREGVPRSLIEALAMDKSIITCNTIGNRETVINGWNGLFCIPGSANSLASCILKIDRKFLLNAQGKSMKLAEIKFNVSIIDDKVFESYFS
jgi:N,N'-diacetylbacillosaminyl-diphospho-undecaprenol alpha-1,3-N-acetylgalactosaminyltransferase